MSLTGFAGSVAEPGRGVLYTERKEKPLCQPQLSKNV